MTTFKLNKILWSKVLALSFFVLVFQLVCIGDVSVGTGVEIDCDQLLSEGGLKNIEKDRVIVAEEFEDYRGKVTLRNKEIKLPKPPGEL